MVLFDLDFDVCYYRCSQIMGRSEQDELTAAQILYPCMQCADIFFLKVLAFCF
jgi:tyrosyl-tRNA synthetase